MNDPSELSAARQLAGLAGLHQDEVPDDVLLVASQCLLDGLGVGVGGAEEPAVTRLLSVLSSGDVATIIGGGRVSSMYDAALVNGTAMHALDFDDVSAPMLGHPTAPVLPALLALGERLDSTLVELRLALVAGIEAEVRLAVALGTSHYAVGFHTTATTGAVGAAVACAQLLGLDGETAARAVSTAATQAAGLKASFGTDCKPLHAGRAAQTGLLSTLLAAEGFTAAEDAIGGRQGLAATQSTSWDAARLRPTDPATWYTRDIAFKVHAACYLTHGSIEGVLALTDPNTRADRIELHVPTGHLKACAIEDPGTGLEGKFSLRYVAALTAVRRRVTEDLFDPAAMHDPQVRSVMERVTVVPHDDMSNFLTRVVATTDGVPKTITVDMQQRRWQASPAEQWDRLADKFRGLAAPVIGAERADRVMGFICHDPSGVSVRQLLTWVRRPG